MTVKTNQVTRTTTEKRPHGGSSSHTLAPAPSLKRAILEVTPRPVLSKMVDDFGVAPADRRSGRAMGQALARTRRARVEEMLAYLDDETLQRTCFAFQVRPEASRARTIERLVETSLYRVSGSEVALHADGSFAALGVLCADPGRDSACAIQVIRVDNGRISGEARVFVRPPRRRVMGGAAAAGLTWSALRKAGSFATAWRSISPLLTDVTFLAAHNGAFARSVVGTCCADARIPPPAVPVQCTARLARRVWQLEHGGLSHVQSTLGLRRGDDVLENQTRAAADIVVAAQRAARR